MHKNVLEWRTFCQWKMLYWWVKMPQWRPQLPCCNPRWTSETLSNTHSPNRCTFWTNLISGTKFIAQTCIKVERCPTSWTALTQFQILLSFLFNSLCWIEMENWNTSIQTLRYPTKISYASVPKSGPNYRGKSSLPTWKRGSPSQIIWWAVGKWNAAPHLFWTLS